MKGSGKEIGAKRLESCAVAGLGEVEGLADQREGPFGKWVIVQIVEDGEYDLLGEVIKRVLVIEMESFMLFHGGGRRESSWSIMAFGNSSVGV